MQRLLPLLLVVSATFAQTENRWLWNTREQRGAGDSAPSENFRSISARSYPKKNYPSNIFDILTDDTIQQKVETKYQDSGRNVQNIATSGLYPYPFGAKPIDLGDGTSIGFAPFDTLPVVETPKVIEDDSDEEDVSKNKLTDVINDERYTTLDRLNRKPVKLPDPNSYSESILGGLHPDEVHYADNNLVIIKGGGFRPKQPVYHDLHNGLKKVNLPVGNSLIDQELTEQPTHVRPIELFSKVPIPFRFLNGNIPTVVRSSQRDTNGFIPNQMITQQEGSRFQPNYQKTSASNIRYQRIRPVSNSLYASTILPSQPSNYRYQAAVIPSKQQTGHVTKKRSANPKVVQYHYQTRGNDAKPIVNYQVHSNGDLTKGNLQITRLNGNSIRKDQKGSPSKTRPESGSSKQDFSELEDFSTPLSLNPLIPTVQTPRQRPGAPRLPVSLRGDTDVNFLEPRPRLNPLAERAGRRPVTTSTNPRRREPINRNRERQPSFFVPLHEPSLSTSQPINKEHQSSTIIFPGPTQSSAPETSARFIEERRPTVQRLRPQNRRAINSGNNRFMEPRRRRPITKKSIRPRV